MRWKRRFYVYENNQLVRVPGHFIYYEKNDPMQAYMIDMSENKSIEETEHVPDRAVIDFRRTVRGKKKETTESEKSEKAKKHSARNRWLAGGVLCGGDACGRSALSETVSEC